MSTESNKALDSSIAYQVVGCLLAFCAVVVGLVSWQQGTPALSIQWITDGTLSESVRRSMEGLRYQIAAAGLVTLNFILFFLQRYRQRHNTPKEVTSHISKEKIDDPESLREPSQYTLTDDEPLSDCETDILANALTEELQENASLDAEGFAPVGDSRDDDTKRFFSSPSQSQLTIATDELSRVRRELVACRQQLETANQAKAQFLANMSHELRTPMNGIMGMTDLLLGGTLTAREERFVRSISASSTTLLAIINDLLDFSKIESGILKLELGRFSVRDCVEDVCASLASIAHNKNIELICYVDDNVPKHMDGDPSRVRQILNNLINNAIAFTDEGEVVVRLTRKSGEKGKSVYQCDVQDTGIGISPELQLQLFEAFTQADASNTRGHGGLGMGLAIAKQLVSMMKGEITFKSRLAEGTRFSFTMELDDVDDTEDSMTRRRSLHGAHVLVVDDNETNRTILYHQLSNWGLIVETVESGKLALEALRAAHERDQGFDVLILDLHMPEMDGIQLAKAIQAEEDFRHIQSIMLTSAILQLDGMELKRLGIYKYVSKPARQSVLHDSLASLMPMVGPRISTDHHMDTHSPASLSNVGARVLLVEDNPVNQDVAMGMLEQLGCDVALATDGQNAVEMGESEKFDIVLMDCQMPTMDGYEATRIIKGGDSVNAPTPIVALTANAMEGDREKCLQAGMDDYVSKPVRTQMLSHMLEKWVGKPNGPFREDEHSQTPALQVSGSREDDLTTVSLTVDVNVGEELPVEVDSSSVDAKSAPDIQADAQSKDAEEPAKELNDEPVDEVIESVINLKAINTIRGLQRPGKPDLLAKVVSVYFDKTPEVIETMRSALDASDFDVISASAHSLKSSSAYLGADALSKTCRNVEAAIESGDHSQLPSLVNSIGDNYKKVEAELAVLVESSDKAA